MSRSKTRIQVLQWIHKTKAFTFRELTSFLDEPDLLVKYDFLPMFLKEEIIEYRGHTCYGEGPTLYFGILDNIQDGKRGLGIYTHI